MGMAALYEHRLLCTVSIQIHVFSHISFSCSEVDMDSPVTLRGQPPTGKKCSLPPSSREEALMTHLPKFSCLPSLRILWSKDLDFRLSRTQLTRLQADLQVAYALLRKALGRWCIQTMSRRAEAGDNNHSHSLMQPRGANEADLAEGKSNLTSRSHLATTHWLQCQATGKSRLRQQDISGGWALPRGTRQTSHHRSKPGKV